METLTTGNSFSIFRQTTNQKRGFSNKKTDREIFEQVIPPTPANSESRKQEYLLGDLSAILSNQSLSQEQITKSQYKVIDEKFNSLLTKYEIYRNDEVKKFLQKNRFLIKFLEEIPSKVFRYFGDSQKLALKVSYESEFPNSSELRVEILTELSAKEAMPILEKFDEEWWLENMDRADCKLNITLKFV